MPPTSPLHTPCVIRLLVDMSASSQNPLRVLFILKNMAMGGISKVACQYMAALQKESSVKLSVLILSPVRDKWALDFLSAHHIDYISGFLSETWTKKTFFLWKWVLKTRAHFQKKTMASKLSPILAAHDILLDFSSCESFPFIRHAGKPMLGWAHSNFATFQKNTAYKISLPEYARIVGLTDDFCQAYRNAYPELAEKVIRLYNPIDVDAARQAAEEKPAAALSAPYFITVQRLDALEKATHTVISAFERFRKTHPEYQLCIVGDGPQRDELHAQAASVPHITFTGSIPNPLPLIKGAKALILSSVKQSREGLPTVLLEAQTLGVPAVAADVASGPADILLNGKAGYLFEAESVDSLYEALCHAVEYPEESARKVALATEQLGRFSVENIISELVHEMYRVHAEHTLHSPL